MLPGITSALFPAAGAIGGGIDAYTIVMLHFDGTDGSTVITDHGNGAPKTWTAGGTGVLDTAIVKFGTAAFLSAGGGGYVTTPDHADFSLGSGDWTVDCWINRSSFNANRIICGQQNAGGNNNSIQMQFDASNHLVCRAYSSATVNTAITGTLAITTSGWHHIAFVRTGNILRQFIDGVQDGGDAAFSSAVFDANSTWAVGRSGAFTTLLWLGSIDEFRISKGIARWTADFTPPTQAYT